MTRFLAVVAVVIIAMFGIIGMSAAFEDAGKNNNIDGESWTPNAGSVTTLEYSNINDAFYDDNVTVYDNNGKQVQSGEDYVWYESNGTVKAVVGGDLDGATSATIDYGYQVPNDKQKALASLSGGLLQFIGPILFIGMFVVIVAATRGLA